MNTIKSSNASDRSPSSLEKPRQKIAVFQQNNRGESKIKGVREHGENLFKLEVYNIDESLPAVIDDASGYLPESIDADLVLDFLVHPDLTEDLAALCERLKIPLVASGKKTRNKWATTPPT